jgi:hypothetical protein
VAAIHGRNADMAEDMQDRLEALYREVVELGDRARGWFDGPGLAWRATLPIDAQAAVAVEGLGTTARLLGVMAWLLDPAHGRGERPAFVMAAEADELPEGSPLLGTPGGEVAAITRRLLTRAGRMAGSVAGEDD